MYNLKRFAEGSDRIFRKTYVAHIFLYEIHIIFTFACEEEYGHSLRLIIIITFMDYYFGHLFRKFSRINLLENFRNTLPCNPHPNPNPNPNDITHLSQSDVAAMAKILPVSICNDTTFFLHAVHLSLMKFIFGLYGPKEGLYKRLQDQWDDLPMNSNSNQQLIHYLLNMDVEVENEEEHQPTKSMKG